MYEDIIRRAPRHVQERIRYYADAVEHDTSEYPKLLEPYGVESVRELVQHLVEYECGTPYLDDDPLISDYKLFWSHMGKMFGEDNIPDKGGS